MADMADIEEQQVQELRRLELGASFDRALLLFHRYDAGLRHVFVNTVRHASEQKRVEEILEMLEKQYERDHRTRH